ncbi:DUF6230 family protein [Smaragdicoccus niigatensis]|uniref:DUF6230 family protein n=1 Tax=Smaragdicoccus niigatensis TaxID=359359 RepID=UPI00038239DE|nr:DUF6230 family protein [Smaragdicoccus niigatensis]
MTDSTSRYGTRWLRALLFMIAALVPVAILGAATAKNALAMAMATQSLRGTFTTQGIVTNDAVGIIIHPQLAKDANGNTYKQYVVKLQATNATVQGLCVAEKMSVFGQTMTILIETGDQAVQVTGVWATLHTVQTSLNASGSLQLNQNASDVVAGGESLGGVLGELGITTQGATLGPAHGTLQAANIKGASLADFHARLVPGDVSC